MASRYGMGIQISVIAVILLIGGLAVSTGGVSKFIDSFNFADNENIASDKSNCQSQASQYCVNRPDGNWSNVHKSCMKYADAIDNEGDKFTCPTGYEQVEVDNNGDSSGDGGSNDGDSSTTSVTHPDTYCGTSGSSCLVE